MPDTLAINGAQALANHILLGHDCIQEKLPEETLAWLSQRGDAQLKFHISMLPLQQPQEVHILKNTILLQFTKALMIASESNLEQHDDSHLSLLHKAAQKTYSDIRFSDSYYSFIQDTKSNFHARYDSSEMLGHLLNWTDNNIQSRASIIISLGHLLLAAASDAASKIEGFDHIPVVFKWQKMDDALGKNQGAEILLNPIILTSAYDVNDAVQVIIHECLHRIDNHIHDIKGIQFDGFDVLHMSLINFISELGDSYDDVLYYACPTEKHGVDIEFADPIFKNLEASRKLDLAAFKIFSCAGDIARIGLLPS